jgi:hypothetical protein
MAPVFPAVQRNSIIRGADQSVQSDGLGRSRVSGENLRGPINCRKASANVTIRSASSAAAMPGQPAVRPMPPSHLRFLALD